MRLVMKNMCVKYIYLIFPHTRTANKRMFTNRRFRRSGKTVSVVDILRNYVELFLEAFVYLSVRSFQ